MNGLDKTARDPERVRRAIADLQDTMTGIGFVYCQRVVVDSDFIYQRVGEAYADGAGTQVTFSIGAFPPGTGIIGQMLAVDGEIIPAAIWNPDLLTVKTNLQNSIPTTAITGRDTVLNQVFLSANPFSAGAGDFADPLDWQITLDFNAAKVAVPVIGFTGGTILLMAFAIQARSTAPGVSGVSSGVNASGYSP